MTDYEHNTSTKLSEHSCNCGSSDANILYDDGHMHCFSCDTTTPKHKVNMEGLPSMIPNVDKPDANAPKGTVVGPIKERGIVADTVRHYRVRLKRNKEGLVSEHYYPYTVADGEIVAYKVRTVDTKAFKSEGPISKTGLFGQSQFPKGGKYISIFEGEIDTMAGFQMNGSKFPCVGIKSSGAGYKDCKEQFEWLDTFDNIILCLDADVPGQKAANQIAELFPKKCKIVKLDPKLKDAGKYLELGKTSEYTNLWWRAEKFTPSGIISGYESALAIINQPRAEAAFMYPWEGLNKKTYGIRKGEMSTVIAGSGSGKTSVTREIAYHILKENPEANIGMLYLEETGWETTRGLISLDLDKPTHLPDTHVTQQEIDEATMRTWGTDRVHSLNDSWEENNIEFIGDKITYFAKGLDCDFVVLDHISFMVSNDNNDERKSLDRIAHKLKALTVDLDIHICVVAHTKRVTGTPLEEGGTLSLSDIRGTAGIGQLSNIVMGIERNSQSDDDTIKNTTTIRVVKNRFCGRNGIATRVLYDEFTGRMTEIEEEDA